MMMRRVIRGSCRRLVTYEPLRSRVEASNLTRLALLVESKHERLRLSGRYDAADYAALHRWSVNEPEVFWKEVFEDLGMPGSLGSARPGRFAWRSGSEAPGGVKWFPEAEVNHAECLLQGEGVALWEADERSEAVAVSYDELRSRVARVAKRLRDDFGVRSGDATAGVVRNDSDAVVAMLAATSLGASWSSVSPDLGEEAASARINAVNPKVLFASSKSAYWRSKETNVLEKVYSLKNIEATIIPTADMMHAESETLTFDRGPFKRPVYVMFTSGTTGPPKCLVQGFGATLLQAKEGAYQFDLKAKETSFWYTSTSWMMWNWLLGAGLSTRGTALLYDGDPFAKNLWALASNVDVNLFGSSAGYFGACQLSQEKNPVIFPKNLKVLGSTGSPCAYRTFEWIRDLSHRTIPLVSTSGGTDLNGSLCTGNPWLPVRAGSLQSPGLGLDVDVRDADTGLTSLPVNVAGELVVASAFPSAPLFFKNDDSQNTTYRSSYFADDFAHGTVWRHGDFAERDEFGGFVIHGRSDATLNVGGVRIGSADIYNALEGDPNAYLVVPQPVLLVDGRHDSRIILFIDRNKFEGSHPGLTPSMDIVDTIQQTLRTKVSPRHVPAAIVFCDEIPTTTNGKKVEIAVARTLANRPVRDRGALANPKSLDFFDDVRELIDNIAQEQTRGKKRPPAARGGGGGDSNEK